MYLSVLHVAKAFSYQMLLLVSVLLVWKIVKVAKMLRSALIAKLSSL